MGHEPRGVRRRTVLNAALAGGLALPLAGCSDSSGVNAEDGFAIGDGNYAVIAPADRKPAPEISGTTLDGKQLNLADHKGKVVVVNVWGSWCPPCRHEAPALVEAAKKTKDTAQFIGLNTRDTNTAQGQAFVRTFGITYPNFYDPDGSLLLAFKVLPAKAIPSTLVIDKEGRIAARILGEATTSTLVGVVEDIAAGK
ncbi:TlpA family protein disulfide reductase [Luteococcus sp. H138]|uniref:TlpA family protein disulfide reductase n=1 Tax=unclassified Luteococcus TaxID=2639923 RepID=UPI00406C5F02